ncbi:hypothetical protein MUK70_02345 [Dyadobacter chenwenxiniae]|uniref:Uncharacterized protein n=1 Tax=Dyadobacter chenwenxiniae TaxID=2906456 RepID=A0A9X1TEU5_9BACT|nr:hypothetical protein [Dyadobacter chenwenxiniae]MCF0062412.1 hypothetical protein [Dyadobacter chenwenxiniae]UON83836.1 hypothetical protein MUK70_02345 [Dyadobacter chenwenxiniae]
MPSITSHYLFVKLVWLLVFLIIAAFWTTVYHYAYNFPYYDDFQSIVLFLTHYIQSDSLSEKLILFFEQNFEHRVVLAKLLTLGVFLVTGQVNIKILIILGDLSLLGTLFLMFKFFSKKQISLPGFFTIVCLLFQVQHYEDTISWATCSLQHAPCLFFSMWSFYLALRRKSAFWSSVLAILALFTSANGLSAVIILMIITAYSNIPKLHKMTQAAFLLFITAVHLLTIKIHSGSMLDHVFKHVAVKSVLLLSFVGQLADTNYTNSMVPSVVLGIVFLFPITIVLKNFFEKTLTDVTTLQWFCFAGIISLLFVGFLIVFARGVMPDFDGYRMDRYKIYSAFFAIFSVAFYDRYWTFGKAGSLVKIAVAAASLAFCISSYYIYYDKITHFSREISANELNYSWSKTIYYPVIFEDVSITNYLDFAQRNFMLSDRGRLNALLSNINWKQSEGNIAVDILNMPDRIVISNAPNSQINQQADELYVVATDPVNNQPKYFCLASNNYVRSVKNFYTTFKKSVGTEFTSTIYKRKLKPGNYNLHLLSIRDRKSVSVHSIGEITL